MLIQLLKVAVLPPVSLLIAGSVGLLVRKRLPRCGRTLAVGSLIVGILLMVPWVAAALLRSLQSEPPLRDAEHLDAGSIVVIAADFAPYAAEYGAPDIGSLTQDRLRYGAYLARISGLPILVSGGTLQHGAPSLASLMATSLRRDFHTEARWKEDQSRSTRQNARCSAELLRPEGIDRIVLVTHAWHMPRAKASFEAAGLEVIAAPTAFHPWPGERLPGLVPSAHSLRESAWAIHEWIGRLWYALDE
ncbi:MAG: YdcF family protein [bacterium]|nr:YdcF family protein [bacterium]